MLTELKSQPSIDLSVRYAEPDDLPAIRDLIDRSVTRLLGQHYAPEAIEALRAVALPKELPDRQLLIAELAGTPAGCAGWSDPEPPERRARIRSVYTDPEFAGFGVGSMLLGLAEAGCFAAGYTRLRLKSSLPAVEFYRRHGWVPGNTERLLGPNGTGFDVVAMQKDLGSAALAA